MRNTLTRLTLTLAGMGLNEKELWILLSELRTISPELMVKRVNSIQRSAVLGDSRIYDNPRIATLKFTHSDKEPSVGSRVERLLKGEANLSTHEAAQLLRGKLIQHGLGTNSSIPELYKKSLNIWVDRLAKFIPEKDLLRFATIIRNEHVRGPTSDWPIGGSSI